MPGTVLGAMGLQKWVRVSPFSQAMCHRYEYHKKNKQNVKKRTDNPQMSVLSVATREGILGTRMCGFSKWKKCFLPSYTPARQGKKKNHHTSSRGSLTEMVTSSP